MKRNITLLALTALIAVPGCMSAMERRSQKEQSGISGAKLLGILGLGGGGYYAYTLYNDPVKYQAAKDNVTQWYTDGRQYVEDNPSSAIYGGLGVLALGYLGYKWWTSGTAQDEIVLDTPNAEAVLNRRRQPRAGQTAKVSVPTWLDQLAVLLENVFSGRADVAQAIDPYILNTQDPHWLLEDEKLIERMNGVQLLKLLEIFKYYTVDHIEKTAYMLLSLLTEEQEGVRVLLADALASQDVTVVLNTLDLFVKDNYLCSRDARFVQEKLVYVRELGEIQDNFFEINQVKLDAALAEKLASDPTFHKQFEAAQRAHGK